MEELLLNAFKENNENAIKELLSNEEKVKEIGKYLFEMTKDNKKLLINGKDKLPDLIKFLDSCGYEFEYETDHGNNILVGAVYHNNTKVVKALVEADNFNPYYITANGDNPFYNEEEDSDDFSSALKYAIVNNNEEIIDLIFNQYTGDISEEDFYTDYVEKYVDEVDKYDGFEDDFYDLSFSAFTAAVMFSSVEVVERIISFDKFKLKVYDKLVIDKIDYSTVLDGAAKRKLIEDKLGYEFKFYNSAIIKNKNSEVTGEKMVTLDDIFKRLKQYNSNVLDDEFLTAVEYQVTEDFGDTYDVLIKALLFLIAIELKPESADNFRYRINSFNDKYSMTFTNVANSFIEKEYDFNFIKQQFIPMIDPIFKILMVNQKVNFKTYTQKELIDILSDWKKLISTNAESKILEEIKENLLAIEYDESIFNNVEEETEETNNNVMFESVSNGIPLEVSSIGLSQYRQEYYNAPPRYYSYVGADIVNKNKDLIADGVRITVTFYQDGMIIDKFDDTIGIIQNDSTFHYGSEFRVDEPYDNYSVRITGCSFAKNVDNMDFGSFMQVKNLNYRVDRIEEETKVSCTLKSMFPNYVRRVYVYVQFLKNKKIVGGNYLVQYDVEAYSEYDLLDKFDMAIDCDEIVYSTILEA